MNDEYSKFLFKMRKQYVEKDVDKNYGFTLKEYIELFLRWN